MSRDGIIEGMARAIWVSSYADWVGSMSKAEREAVGAPVNLDGVEWYEETPEAPEAVAGAARELVSLYESENDCSIEDIEARAARAQGRGVDDEVFGRYLAEMAMNTGVSWFDDHKPFKLEKPLLEAYYDGEFFEWSGRCKTTMQNPADLGPLKNIFLKRENNGWHIDAQFAKQTLNYGPFKTKELGMRMREAIIESDLQRNPPSARRLKLSLEWRQPETERPVPGVRHTVVGVNEGGPYTYNTDTGLGSSIHEGHPLWVAASRAKRSEPPREQERARRQREADDRRAQDEVHREAQRQRERERREREAEEARRREHEERARREAPPPPRRGSSGSDPFAVLGFTPGDRLTTDMVKKRYRELARIHHPDMGGSTAKMQDINRAADELIASGVVIGSNPGPAHTWMPQRNCGSCKHNHADDDLSLYIDNDGALYEKYTQPIYVRLSDAKAGGTYSREKAVREFMALADIGEKKYQKEITPRRFTAAEKRDYANSAARYFESEWELGNFADYATEAQTTFNPAGLTAKGERMYEHIKAGYGRDPRAKEIAARTVAARAKNVRGLRNPPFVLPVPGQAIRSWDHGDGHLVKICEEGSDGLYTATIKLATGRSVVVPLTRTEYDLTPRKLLDRRTGFSRHEQFLGPPQPDRLPKGTPMEFEDTDPFAVAPRAPRGPMEFDNDLQEWVPAPRRHSIPRKRR